jgi:serine phosphatase RsbU (regulator of sigma subunit)
MRRARAIQTRLLPPIESSSNGSYEVSAVFRPADSVAGDLYDIVELADGSTLLGVLDVSGHGVAAALYTALLRTVLRHQAKVTCDLARIVAAMNDEFTSVAGDSGEFATCFLVRLDRSTGSLEFVGAGHDPAVIVRADGSVELLEGRGLPIGLGGLEGYATSRSALRPGDRLFLYTDGLHEVIDEQGVQFGRQRLIDLLAKTSGLVPREQLDDVVRSVRSHERSGGFQDDVTLLCARRRRHDHNTSDSASSESAHVS